MSHFLPMRPCIISKGDPILSCKGEPCLCMGGMVFCTGRNNGETDLFMMGDGPFTRYSGDRGRLTGDCPRAKALSIISRGEGERSLVLVSGGHGRRRAGRPGIYKNLQSLENMQVNTKFQILHKKCQLIKIQGQFCQSFFISLEALSQKPLAPSNTVIQIRRGYVCNTNVGDIGTT